MKSYVICIIIAALLMIVWRAEFVEDALVIAAATFFVGFLGGWMVGVHKPKQ